MLLLDNGIENIYGSSALAQLNMEGHTVVTGQPISQKNIPIVPYSNIKNFINDLLENVHTCEFRDYSEDHLTISCRKRMSICNNLCFVCNKKSSEIWNKLFFFTGQLFNKITCGLQACTYERTYHGSAATILTRSFDSFPNLLNTLKKHNLYAGEEVVTEEKIPSFSLYFKKIHSNYMLVDLKILGQKKTIELHIKNANVTFKAIFLGTTEVYFFYFDQKDIKTTKRDMLLTDDLWNETLNLHTYFTFNNNSKKTHFVWSNPPYNNGSTVKHVFQTFVI
jgi:hypothetical protein